MVPKGTPISPPIRNGHTSERSKLFHIDGSVEVCAMTEQIKTSGTASDGGRGDVAAGAGLVLDDELLAELVRQPLRHDPRHDVDRAAGGKADHPVHGAIGIAGGGGARCGADQRRQQNQSEHGASQNSQHEASPWSILVGPHAFTKAGRCLYRRKSVLTQAGRNPS